MSIVLSNLLQITWNYDHWIGTRTRKGKDRKYKSICKNLLWEQGLENTHTRWKLITMQKQLTSRLYQKLCLHSNITALSWSIHTEKDYDYLSFSIASFAFDALIGKIMRVVCLQDFAFFKCNFFSTFRFRFQRQTVFSGVVILERYVFICLILCQFCRLFDVYGGKILK